jgi:hypothetical protein
MGVEQSGMKELVISGPQTSDHPSAGTVAKRPDRPSLLSRTRCSAISTVVNAR